MKKILHIAAHMGGGAGKAISGILKNLSQFENTLLLLEPPVSSRYVDICNENNINTIITSDPLQISKIAMDADIIVLNWWCHPLFVNVFKSISSINARIVLWSHINGLNYPYLPYDFLDMFNLSMFTSPCTYENTLWSETQRKIIERKSFVVYGTGDFHPEKSLYKKDYSINGIYKIGYSGTLNFSKLSSDFPQICYQVHENIKNTEFDLYGHCHDDVKSRFDNSYVKFNGFVNNIEDSLTDMDIFCYPLTKNNFATTENALLEAMAAGLPVVVMNNPPERNIITHNKTGLIAENPQQVSEYVGKLYYNTDLRKQLGENARQHVIEKYSADENVNRFISCINSCIQSDKKQYNFDNITGDSPWDFFLYFCRPDISVIKNILSGNLTDVLPDIYYESSKSSPFHFLRYFPDDKHFNKLIKFILKQQEVIHES